MQPHVLLIDNVDDNRELYHVGLEFLGFRVTAADVSHGLAAAETVRPDLVVLNVEYMEDWNLCDELRAVCGESPVVVLSAFVSPSKVNRRRARGTVNCAAFVGMPCSAEELAGIISRVLGGERGIEQTVGTRRASDA